MMLLIIFVLFVIKSESLIMVLQVTHSKLDSRGGAGSAQMLLVQ